MDRINEFNIEPGPYRYKGSIYVVTELVTHMDNEGHMQSLPEPLVVYRDLDDMVKHVKGKAKKAYQRYAHPLSIFKAKFNRL